MKTKYCSNCNIKMINNISYAFYYESNEYGRWICVDIMNHKTNKVMSYKINTHELDTLGVSEKVLGQL